MTAPRAALALSGLVAGGCGGGQISTRNYVTSALRISIVDALIAPAKVSGLPWDGTGGAIDQGTWGELSFAHGAADPYSAALGILASRADSGTARPDPKGTVLLYDAHEEVEIELPMEFKDTFTPMWSDATLHGVVNSSESRLRITLIDQDVVEDDPNGVVEPTEADLVAAGTTGRVHHHQVSEQSQNQSLFVGISALTETPSERSR